MCSSPKTALKREFYTVKLYRSQDQLHSFAHKCQRTVR